MAVNIKLAALVVGCLFTVYYSPSVLHADEPADDLLSGARQAIEDSIQRAIDRVNAEAGRDDAIPPQNEIVMSPGMKIVATTPSGTITIEAGNGLRRSYTWEGATRSVHMWPRNKRWYGSLGIYFPGSGDHWAPHNGITRAVVEEGQQHFKDSEAAHAWIEKRKAMKSIYGRPFMEYVFRDDGLTVGWSKTPERNQLNVEVWQIYIDKERPDKLRGSQDDKIVIELP